MFEYNICNQADEALFERQCTALESKIAGLREVAYLEDVDGSLTRVYQHPRGVVRVKNDTQVDAVYVIAEFDLLPYFR